MLLLQRENQLLVWAEGLLSNPFTFPLLTQLFSC